MTVDPPKKPPAWFVHAAWRVHRLLYRLTGGRFLWTTTNKRGWGALLLTTTGRTSGQERNVIIGYLEDGPDLVAIAMKAAISALEGNPMPQLISVPLPVATYDQLEDGTNYWSDLPDNFFTVNEFPPCGVNISGPAIMAQTEADIN